MTLGTSPELSYTVHSSAKSRYDSWKWIQLRVNRRNTSLRGTLWPPCLRNVAEQRGSKFKCSIVQKFSVKAELVSKRSSRSTASLRSKRYRRTAASRRSYDSRKRLATKTISQRDPERSESPWKRGKADLQIADDSENSSFQGQNPSERGVLYTVSIGGADGSRTHGL